MSKAKLAKVFFPVIFLTACSTGSASQEATSTAYYSLPDGNLDLVDCGADISEIGSELNDEMEMLFDGSLDRDEFRLAVDSDGTGPFKLEELDAVPLSDLRPVYLIGAYANSYINEAELHIEGGEEVDLCSPDEFRAGIEAQIDSSVLDRIEADLTLVNVPVGGALDLIEASYAGSYAAIKEA